MVKTIKILGAGISGLTAAINLAKNGFQVIVCEREPDVGKRFHGDIQGLENGTETQNILEELKSYNIDADFDFTQLNNLTITNCKKSYDIALKKPLHYLVKRGPFPGTLDYSLKNQALSSGVQIRFCSKDDINNFDIVATGPISSKTNAIAKGLVFTTSIDKLAVGIYNDNMAYKGYSYLLISKGYGCMASVVYSDFSKIKECFDYTEKYFKEHYDLKISTPRPMAGIGCFSTSPVFQKGNQLFTGEAAGLQDFVAGFGMRYAFQSGYLAAQSIISNRNYQQLCVKKFLPNTRSCIVNRWLWETVLHLNNYSYMLYIYKLMANSNNVSSFHFSAWQKLLYPIASRYIKRNYPNI